MPSISSKVINALKKDIPELATRIAAQVHFAYVHDAPFHQALHQVLAACQRPPNAPVRIQAVEEMLVQHLLTERFFHLVFRDKTVLHHNSIAVKMEALLQTLPLDRETLLAPFGEIYGMFADEVKDFSWREKRQVLSTLYEQFFHVFSREQARTYGIVYTPPEIVHFMCQSVASLLQQHFRLSLSDPQVKILDPCTGTGSFLLALLDLITETDAFKTQYTESLFCNEILLYPYYLASLLIEQEYVQRVGTYLPFEGICYTDTLCRDPQPESLSSLNQERIVREQEAPIMVVLGNPPFDVGRKHLEWGIDQRIKESYTAVSQSSVRNYYYSDYVRFLRWSTDRLHGQAGILCFITNNSFVTDQSLDGIRKCLVEEFTHIYHLDLGGNTRRGDRDGNIMGGQVGLGMTILVRTCPYEEQKEQPAWIHYYQLRTSSLRRSEATDAKLTALATLGSVEALREQGLWHISQSESAQSWVMSQEHPEEQRWVPIGVEDLKNLVSPSAPAIFRMYGGGIKTNRDKVLYEDDREVLTAKTHQFIEEVNQASTHQHPKDDYTTLENTWTGDLREKIQKGKTTTYDERWVRQSVYRPFLKKYLYADPFFVTSLGQQLRFFPHTHAEQENTAIALPGRGNRQRFGCFAMKSMATTDMGIEKALYFPYYTYDEQGQHTENVTDWALDLFRESYGSQVCKLDIFHYVYAILHHPQYRERFANQVRRGFPRIPLVASTGPFQKCVTIGEQLLVLHTQYEQQVPYTLTSYTRQNIPPECAEYTIGNSPAYKWILDQVKKTGSQLDAERFNQVVTVCVETVRRMHELRTVAQEDTWQSQDKEGIPLPSIKQGDHLHQPDYIVLLYSVIIAALFGVIFFWPHRV